MSVDTKAEREYAEAIYKYTNRCDEAAKHIDRLSYEVDRLRKELSSSLRAYPLMSERAREEEDEEVELLRKQNWQARQKIGTLEQEVERLRKELNSRMNIDVSQAHINLCREQLIDLLKAKTDEVNNEDE